MGSLVGSGKVSYEMHYVRSTRLQVRQDHEGAIYEHSMVADICGRLAQRIAAPPAAPRILGFHMISYDFLRLV